MLAYGTQNVYAAGDCATLYTGNAMIDELGALFRKAGAALHFTLYTVQKGRSGFTLYTL